MVDLQSPSNPNVTAPDGPINHSLIQEAVTDAIYTLNGPLTTSNIVSHVGCDRLSINIALKELEKAGIIQSEVGDDDLVWTPSETN